MLSISLIVNVRRKIAFVAALLIQYPRVVLYRLISETQVTGKPQLHQPLLAMGKGFIRFNGSAHIGVYRSPFYFSGYAYLEARGNQSEIVIGDRVWISNGFVAIADHTSISIGSRVFIGTNVEIFDSDFHGVLVEDRKLSKPEWAKPVVIGDDVFIGSGVRILKGVTIGHGAVIANGAIVTRDIASGVIAGGAPARVIKKIV